jgi:hypothetical protein
MTVDKTKYTFFYLVKLSNFLEANQAKAPNLCPLAEIPFSNGEIYDKIILTNEKEAIPMAIKMRVLYATNKKKMINIANYIKQKYELSQNSVDCVPPAYSCDKERIVVLACAGKSDVEDALRRFCIELTRDRAANVALLIDGTQTYADNIKAILKNAGTNVLEDVMYVKCGLFGSAVKPEEQAAIVDWLDNKVICNLK